MRRYVVKTLRMLLAAAPFIALLVTPLFIYAQNFVPLSGKGVSGVDLAPYMTRAFSGSGKLGDFVNAMFKSALAVGAMLAVLQLARAGFYYMGSDVWAKKEQGKQIMRDAVVGLLILLAIWLILSQINPQLLNLDVLSRISKVSLPTSPSPASSIIDPNQAELVEKIGKLTGQQGKKVLDPFIKQRGADGKVATTPEEIDTYVKLCRASGGKEQRSSAVLSTDFVLTCVSQ